MYTIRKGRRPGLQTAAMMQAGRVVEDIVGTVPEVRMTGRRSVAFDVPKEFADGADRLARYYGRFANVDTVETSHGPTESTVTVNIGAA